MGVKYLIDTSAYSAFNRGDERLRTVFDGNNELIMPLVVVGELRAGFASGVQQKFNEKLLQRFLDSPSVSTCTITDSTTRRYADINARLLSIGRPIGTNDIWIAAHALELNLPIVTLDAHFEYVKDAIKFQSLEDLEDIEEAKKRDTESNHSFHDLIVEFKQ